MSAPAQAAAAPGAHGATVAAWLCAVVAGCSLSFMGVAALAPRITADLGLSPEAVGLFSGLAWSAGLVASFSCARLVQRWGPWAVTRLCLLACMAGVAALAMGSAPLFWVAAVLIGVGQGLEAPPASQLLARHVQPARRPLYFSLKQSGVQLGAVAASLALPALALAWGWRAALWAVAGVLFLFALTLAGPARRHAEPGGQAAVPPSSWLGVLRRRADLRRLAFAACAFGGTQVCMNTFLVTWMVTVREMPLTTAGAFTATAQAAGAVGRPLAGWLASRAGGGTLVMRALGALMACCALLMGTLGPSLPGPALAALAAAFGLSASGWNGVFLSEVAERGAQEGIAAATTAAMVPLYIGLVAGPVAFAGISRWLDLSAGFLALSILATAGMLAVPGRHGR